MRTRATLTDADAFSARELPAAALADFRAYASKQGVSIPADGDPLLRELLRRPASRTRAGGRRARIACMARRDADGAGGDGRVRAREGDGGSEAWVCRAAGLRRCGNGAARALASVSALLPLRSRLLPSMRHRSTLAAALGAATLLTVAAPGAGGAVTRHLPCGDRSPDRRGDEGQRGVESASPSSPTPSAAGSPAPRRSSARSTGRSRACAPTASRTFAASRRW